jgi:hypothetical protein
MAVVKTSLRVTRESAKQIRFYPASPLTATNVQDAIEAAALGGVGASVTVTAGMSPYIPPADITILLVDTSAGPVTINLPLAITRGGKTLSIKDAVGNAAVNNITINATETIDGLPTVTLSTPYAYFEVKPKAGGYYAQT